LILIDSSGLFAALVSDQGQHAAARAVLAAEDPPLLLSPFVLAEVDYFLATRGGIHRELAFLDEVGRGAYELAAFEGRDVSAAAAVIERYRDLEVGLADASIVVLAGRYSTNRVLTLDERHFRALRTPGGDPFVVLPADT
jgi:predicted nucleic acid-binding protein